jgi:hypothetical protein
MNQSTKIGNYQLFARGGTDSISTLNQRFPILDTSNQSNTAGTNRKDLAEYISTLNLRSCVRNDLENREKLSLYSNLFRKQKSQNLRIRNLGMNPLINLF